MSYFTGLTVRWAEQVAALSDGRRKELAAYFLSKRQPDGLFRGRGSTGDDYYTSFAVRGLALLGLAAENAVSCRCGIKDVSPAILTSRLITGVLQAVPPQENYVNIWERYRKSDECFGTSLNTPYSSTYTTFLAALSGTLLNVSLVHTIQPIIDRQQSDGGFTELQPLNRSGTNPTAAATALLTMHGVDWDKEKTAGYLRQRQLPCGGFQAHSGIPAADLLSTFSAITALQDLGVLVSAADFVSSLRCPDGGYCGYAGDMQSDAEYTFYGMILEQGCNT